MNTLKKFNISAILVSLTLFIIILLSVAYSIMNTYKKEQDLVLEHAKNAFDKNIVFRQWVAMHGGVYVFPTKKTPPNPYLENFPDRDLTTTDGRQLTLMNPAYMLRELLENFPGRYNETGHLTSLKLFNPNNKADEWETKVLKKLETKKVQEFHEIYLHNGEQQLRYMRGLITKESCLVCHASQGYKVGDIRGGLSISIPLKEYNAKRMAEIKNIILLHLFILILCTLLGYLFYQKLKKNLIQEIALTEKIKEKDAILAKQSKLASLGEMLNNIAHHWRQPLSIISTSASGLKLQKEFGTLDDETLDQALDGIIDTTRHLSHIITDFSNFVDEHSTKVSFNISENLKNNIQIFQTQSNIKDVNFILDIDSSIFITNHKYAFEKSILYIFKNLKDVFSLVNLEEKYLFISLKKDENNIFIRIKDNALGIKEEVMNKVFEPYITTKHKFESTGLGLYMTYKLITENLNGAISVNNVEYEFNHKMQKGAEFLITLPIKDNE